MLKQRLRQWLGVDDLERDEAQNYNYLKNSIDVLYGEHNDLEQRIFPSSAPHVDESASVEATAQAAYSPDQTGNVVVAEPKLVSVARGKGEM